MTDLPRIVTVTRRTVHNNDNVTLCLGEDTAFAPGQFLMIWLPGINEKPFSIAGRDKYGVWITVRRRGIFSDQLLQLKAGDRLGIRGPYGRPFELTPDCCIVAGGIGFACVAPIAEQFPGVPVLYGENSASSRIYKARFPRARFFSVDGSGGRQGVPTDDLVSLLGRQTACRMVYACGPEPMLLKTIEICRSAGVSCQVSVERYMKCGIGVCGQCACGPVRVCVEGPVFTGDELLANPDFGKRKLDASGRWQPV